jgi:hypothetical protein
MPEPPLYTIGLSRPTAWLLRAVVAAAPLLLLAGLTYILLILTGVAPRPVTGPAIDDNPHDANWLFLMAFGATIFGTLATFIRHGRTTTIALATAALAAAALVTLVAG